MERSDPFWKLTMFGMAAGAILLLAMLFGAIRDTRTVDPQIVALPSEVGMWGGR